MKAEDALSKFLVQLEADGRSSHTIKQYNRHIRLFGYHIQMDGTKYRLVAK